MKSPNKTNTSGKKHSAKNNTNKKSKVRNNYKPVTIGEIHFKTASKAVLFFLNHTSLSQTEIASICSVTQPRVCQLAKELREEKVV